MVKHVQRFLLLAAMLALAWTAQGQNAEDYRLDTGVDSTAWITLSASATHIEDIEGDKAEGLPPTFLETLTAL